MPCRLLARFDNIALRPPAALARETDWNGPPAGAMDVWVRLKTWCFDGALDGSARGSSASAMPIPFSVALVRGGDAATRAQLAESLCQDLDGSVRLAACEEGVARLVFRLRVKLDETLPWRARQPTDPWDCGYVRDDPAGLRRLAQFTPRRASLIVALALPEASLRECLRALALNSASHELPVRLLIVEGEVPLPWTPDAPPAESGGAPFTTVDSDAGSPDRST